MQNTECLISRHAILLRLHCQILRSTRSGDIKQRHCLVEAVTEQYFNDLDRPAYRREDKRFLRRSKGLQNKISRILPARWPADTELHPDEVLPSKRLDQRSHPTIP